MIPHHRVDGPDDAPPVVLSNSLGTNIDLWDWQLPALTRDFRVVRYDQRGHGSSDVPPGPYTFEQLGGDVIELLDHLGIEQASFVGVSMGGMTGMWLAVNAPERIDKLVLSCTTPVSVSAAMWEERAAAARSGQMDSLAEGTIERWFTPGFRQREPQVIASFRAMLVSSPNEGYASTCEALRDWDIRSRLGEIRASTLVIAGAEDPAAPPELGEQIATSIPGARLVVLPAAHIANVELADDWNREVLEHLRG